MLIYDRWDGTARTIPLHASSSFSGMGLFVLITTTSKERAYITSNRKVDERSSDRLLPNNWLFLPGCSYHVDL